MPLTHKVEDVPDIEQSVPGVAGQDLAPEPKLDRPPLDGIPRRSVIRVPL
jgi:hypothetical protein